MAKMDDLLKEQKTLQRGLEAVRKTAETLVGQESAALESDDTYISWTRKRKLADRDAAQLEAALVAIADEIEAETGRQKQAALQRRYNAIKAQNEALQKRLRQFSDKTARELLELIRDLAEDEVNVAAINDLVPWAHRLRSADATVRCASPVQPTEKKPYFTPADEVPSLWKTLVIPRLSNEGGALFDGTRLSGPQAVVSFINSELY